MRLIKFFEEFTEETLKTNNDTYNNYLKRASSDREHMVAWVNPGSQQKNFELVSNYIIDNDSILDYGCGVGDFLKHLEDENIHISNYLGVDINEQFIQIAKDTYPQKNFKSITDVEQISGTYDKVVAIGVFTWFITKKEFIDTINSLWDRCNKEVILTLLHGQTCYSEEDYNQNQEEYYWKQKYRYYDENLFQTLFPDFTFKFDKQDSTFLVRIIK